MMVRKKLHFDGYKIILALKWSRLALMLWTTGMSVIGSR